MIRPVKLRVTPEVEGHTCTVLTDDRGDFCTRWKWTCSCGGRGRWQGQSSHVSVFQWFKHAWRAQGLTLPRDKAPAYAWLKRERET